MYVFKVILTTWYALLLGRAACCVPVACRGQSIAASDVRSQPCIVPGKEYAVGGVTYVLAMHMT